MVILHYFLGFPPYRSGGLTTYSVDLMWAQKKKVDKLIALWPGNMKLFSKKIQIVRRKNIDNIINYELINPLPIPLDEGIKDISAYTEAGESYVYSEFLTQIRPDIIHIHTLMGLHKEFIDVAKKMNIKIIFTSHDYFGICPKVTLYKNGDVCKNDNGCRDCVNCNQTALSLNKIKIMQSSMYRKIKSTYFVSAIRKLHRQKFFEEEKKEQLFIDKNLIEEKARAYRRLRKFYIKILQNIDVIHFNSSLTKNVYEQYFKLPKNKVLSISHKNIKDNRNVNTWNYQKKVRLTCLAPAKPFKGYNVLIDSLDKLWKHGNHNFSLKMFNNVPDKRPYMTVQEEGFVYSDLKKIMEETDILIAPSVSYETFGFTVLEALSFGVPVIVSNHVGAKDIVKDAGIIVEAGDVSGLCEAILSLNEKKLNQLRKNVKHSVDIISWKQFIGECYKLYNI